MTEVINMCYVKTMPEESEALDQRPSVPFVDVAKDLDEKLRGLSGDSFTLKDLLIPQQALDQRPFYPAIHNFIIPSNVFNEATDHDRSPLIEERGRAMFGLLSELPELQLSNQELIEARKDPEKLKEFYLKPSVMHEVRLTDFLLDNDRANILRFWVTMSDANFQRFLDLVKKDKLPKCLTSDEEMKRLLDDFNSLQKPKLPAPFLKGGNVSVFSTERPHLFSARERLVDLVLHPDYYIKDENGHALTPQMGGPKNYEFDPNIDILSIMGKLRAEFPGEEK